MKTSEAGIAFIEGFEQYCAKPYRCPAGVATIGFGSTRYANGSPVKMTDPSLTLPGAVQLLANTLGLFEKAVNQAIRVPMTQGQFDSFCSLAYNIGTGAFALSTLVSKFNAGDAVGASLEFPRWNKASAVVLPGLVRRREAERKMFLGIA